MVWYHIYTYRLTHVKKHVTKSQYTANVNEFAGYNTQHDRMIYCSVALISPVVYAMQIISNDAQEFDIILTSQSLIWCVT